LTELADSAKYRELD